MKEKTNFFKRFICFIKGHHWITGFVGETPFACSCCRCGKEKFLKLYVKEK